MASDLSSLETAKSAAAAHAVELVEDGMRVGLGSGSTSERFVNLLGKAAKSRKLCIDAVATSTRTASVATAAGIKVSDLNDVERLDILVDGADEFDSDLNLIKGGGGALLREKIVAGAASRMVVIADFSKRVEHLGAFPLPVEVVRFGWKATHREIRSRFRDFGVDCGPGRLRGGDRNSMVTDEGHFILDFHTGRINAPAELTVALNQIAGVVENGLFVGYCDIAIIGLEVGGVETLSS